jgi:hypothetical protein
MKRGHLPEWYLPIARLAALLVREFGSSSFCLIFPIYRGCRSVSWFASVAHRADKYGVRGHLITGENASAQAMLTGKNLNFEELLGRKAAGYQLLFVLSSGQVELMSITAIQGNCHSLTVAIPVQ